LTHSNVHRLFANYSTSSHLPFMNADSEASPGHSALKKLLNDEVRLSVNPDVVLRTLPNDPRSREKERERESKRAREREREQERERGRERRVERERRRERERERESRR
jgi:hypothetical protein